MGEEPPACDYGRPGSGDEGDYESRVLEWEIGLPTDDDLTPLSQSLIPPELACAFSITPEPARTMLDVLRASQTTVSSLRRHTPSDALKSFPHFPCPADDPMVVEGDDPASASASAKDSGAGEPSRKMRRTDPLTTVMEETDSSALRPDNSNDDQSARTLKRPRLVWTPQLHKRFVDVVAHLGIKNAVPKTIMQLMNVEGLTRENVASHLQKYRLYLKRMQGLSNEGPSSSDHLFASTPVPQSLHEQPPPPPVPMPMPMPMPYTVPTMIPMPVFSMPHHHGHGHGSPVGMVPVNNHQGSPGAYHGFESHHPYGGAFVERPKDWSSGNNFGSIVSYPRVSPNDK